MTAQRIAWLLLIACLALLAWIYPQLPERVATHFDGRGDPNGWMSRASMAVVVGGGVVFLNLMLAGMVPVLNRLPFSMVNVPHKAFWMSTPERQVVVRRRIRSVAGLSQAWTNSLFLVALHFIAQENGVPVLFEIEPSALGPLLLGWIGLFVVGILVWMLAGFRPPAAEFRRFETTGR